MINCFLCPYPFLNSPCLFVNKTFNTYVSTQISKFELHTYVPGLTLLGVLVMRMTLEINQLGCFKSNFTGYLYSWLSFTTCSWCNCSPGRVQSWCSQGRTCLLLLSHFLLNTYFTGFLISKCNFSRQMVLWHLYQTIESSYSALMYILWSKG